MPVGLQMLFVLRMLLMSLHFVLAGVLGVLLGLCRPFNPDNSRLCARLYAWPAMCILRLRVKADVGPLMDKSESCVIIANHQSNYDLFVFGNVVPRRTVCIGKKSLKWVPLFGQLFWLAGNVLIDRGNAHKARQSMLTTTHTLQHEDTCIWVFPEGTRNLGEELLAAAVQERGISNGDRRRRADRAGVCQQLRQTHAIEPLAQWENSHPLAAGHSDRRVKHG